MTDLEKERERCRVRRIELGPDEAKRRMRLLHEARELCHKLVLFYQRTEKVERILQRAEARRSRRQMYLRGHDASSVQ